MFPYRLTAWLLLAKLVGCRSSGDVSDQGPSTVLQYKEWNSIGCHTDSTSGRTLKHLVAVSSPNMTVESCLDSCATGGYILGGVEFGEECYCGNALLYGYGASQACNKPCSGNASELCGGPVALNLYQFADTPFTTGPASTVLGYKNWLFDGPGVLRLLPHEPPVPIPGEQMTVERCLDGCEAGGYNAAALEAGQECFCDLVPNGTFQPPGWESTGPADCADPCLANATEICGGTIDEFFTPGRLTTYVTCEFFERC
ncbi:WSC domain-containing protein [Mycena leptocephala]|nr:WSC domain-containing protein [Mycena leptocephala]